MTPAALRHTVRLHGKLLVRAAERRASAAIHRDSGHVERAEMAEDEAAELRTYADALRDLLALHPDVLTPDPRQLSLLSDGEDR